MKTNHFNWRRENRSLDDETLDLILAHGRRIHRAGAIHITVCERDCWDDLSAAELEHTRGWVVLISRDGALITCYRSSHAHHAILCKTTFDCRGARRTRFPSESVDAQDGQSPPDFNAADAA